MKTTSPTIWIERLAILKSIKPVQVVREIQFRKGLNIIWGKEMPDVVNGNQALMLSGHSVGKTSLCRLIRYCLGESSYGPDVQEEAIRSIFSEGYVCAQVNINDIIWVVCRPFGKGKRDLAELHGNIDKVLNGILPDKSYNEFLDAIEDSTMKKLPQSYLTEQEVEYRWPDLLCWLARDQETRFRSLHEWRTARSEAHGRKLGKEQALRLMRIVLGLIHENELRNGKDLNIWTDELSQLSTQSEKAKNEPKQKKTDCEVRISSLIGMTLNGLTGEEDNLLNFAISARNGIDLLQKRILKLQVDITELDDNILLQQITISSYHEELERVRFELQALSSKSTVESDDRSKQIEKYNEVKGSNCTYSARPFSECQYFVANLNALHERQLEWERSNKRLFTSLTETEQVEYLCQMSSELGALRETYLKAAVNKSTMQNEKRTKEEERAQLYHSVRTAEDLLISWQETEDILNGKTENTELKRLLAEINTVTKNISAGKEKLRAFRDDYETNRKALTQIYDDLLKGVLNDNYSGTVSLSAGELKFGITEDAGYRGEAIETLSLVLADVAAMMSAGKVGFHPGFLMHDSPREADLDRHIYNRFFNAIYSVVSGMGGPDKCSFQYIVTTTSAPPKEIIETDVIRANLSSYPPSEMLFGCSLRKAEAEQTELFTQKVQNAGTKE